MDWRVENDQREFTGNNRDLIVEANQTELIGGHAWYTKDKYPYVPPNGLTKQQYVKANVNSDLKDEGEATLTSAEIEGNKPEHIKAEHVEKVDSNASRDIDGDHKEKIAGKLSLVVSGAQHQTVGSVYTLQAGNEIHLHAGTKVVIEGGMEVSIKGSGGFVDIGAKPKCLMPRCLRY